MTEERLVKIFEDGCPDDWELTFPLKGFNILSKYSDFVIVELEEGGICGPDTSELISAGITEEDALELVRIGFIIIDGDYIKCPM